MIKKWNIPLSLIAFINIIGYLFIFNYLEDLGQGMAIFGMFLFPIYFLLITGVVITFCVINRKKWFTKNILFSSIFCLFFCTPIPLIAYHTLDRQFSTRIVSQTNGYTGPNSSEEITEYSNGEIFKTEWIHIEEERINENDSADVWKEEIVVEERHWYKKENSTELLKDSTWIYFNNKKDTLKIEYFKDGILLNTKIF